jgi:hypothetical protein
MNQADAIQAPQWDRETRSGVRYLAERALEAETTAVAAKEEARRASTRNRVRDTVCLAIGALAGLIAGVVASWPG